MTITSNDLKFRQAERMTDFSDGGGRMSATVVVDGTSNNVFSDLSDANSIIGNVSLRKIFGQVDTANTDTFLGPFVFLTDPPVNPTVTICAFNTESATDERATAKNYVESYRIAGVKSQFILYGDHFNGQQTLQVYCRPEIVSPDIGDVLMLSVERAGYPPAEQFVAVQEVASRQTVTFTDSSTDFEKDVLILTLTSSLQQDFEGQQDPKRIDASVTSPTLVRKSQVNDAAKFYGLAACTTAPQTGDTVIDIGSPYIHIVPTTQGETPVVDQLAGLGTVGYVQSGATAALSLSWSDSAAAGVLSTRYFGSPYKPGTLSVTVSGTALRDDGHGGIEPVNQADTGWSGSADYGGGSVSVARDVGFSGSLVATATPAAVVVQQTYQRSIPIKAANRSQSYVFQLPGQPSPGTVTIDFLALGKWVRLSDTGRGQARGQPGEGSATINYATGSVAVTLGALPDVDSALLISWGTDLRARNASGEVSVPTPQVYLQLDHAGVSPGTFDLSWVSGGSARTASADAAGALTGDATGYMDHTAGTVAFTTALVPDVGELYQCSYSYIDPAKVHSEVFTPMAAGGAVSVTLAHAAEQNSVVARWTLTSATLDAFGNELRQPYAARDDGVGGWTGQPTGTSTINYATGAVALTVE